MMSFETLFIELLNRSITASWLILAVLLVRAVLKKRAPRWLICLLWIPVALRLVLPFSIESLLSLVPTLRGSTTSVWTGESTGTVTGTYGYAPVIPVSPTVDAFLSTDYPPDASGGVNWMNLLRTGASILWAVGGAVLLIYALVGYFRLRRRVATAVRMEDDPAARLTRWQCETVTTPFILGVFRPRVYLPFRMDDATLAHVMAHEQAHIRRGDHVVKPLAYLILAVHWFNPLVWVAYCLLCRDLEIATDERVVKGMDSDARKSYAQALLSCGDGRHRRTVSVCPLAFGEVGVKARIKSVLSYKKPLLWSVIAILAAAVVLVVCFMTDPVREEENIPSDWYGVGNVSDTFCDYDHFYLELDAFRVDDTTYVPSTDGGAYPKTTMRIRLRNLSGNAIGYGEPFHIYREENGVWVSAATQATYFELPLYSLEAGADVYKTYDVSFFDLTKAGRYRFVISIVVPINEYGATEGCEASFEFTVAGTDALASPHPEDFAITFTAQTGDVPNVLDTFEGYMQKDLVTGFPNKATTRYTPSEAELQYLWYLVETYGITEMRSDMHWVQTGDLYVSVTPNTEYVITVRANGRTYTVVGDSVTGYSEDAMSQNFKRFVSEMGHFMASTKQWNDLPEAKGGYC